MTLSDLPNIESAFSELPQALIEEMFHMTSGLAENVSEHVLEMQKGKEDMRNKLGNRIKHDSDICTIPVFPTTAGTDGSYCAERMLATDF